MRLATSSALAAVLGISVSGSVLGHQPVTCGVKPISTGGHDLLKQLNLASQEACTERSKSDKDLTTFESAPFSLEIVGAGEANSIDNCVSAFATIINACTRSESFGGSTTSHSINFTISGIGTVYDEQTKLEARGRVRGGRKAKAKPVKTSKPKNTKTKKPGQKAKKPGKKTKKPGKKIDKSKKKAEKPKACKVKSGKHANKPGAKGKSANRKPLSGRAILLDLIKRTKSGSGDFGNRKTFVFDEGKWLVSDPYPKKSQLDSKVRLYGFSTEDELKKLFGSAEDISKDERNDQHVEHILEWHNVGEFLKEKHLNELKPLLPGSLNELEGKEGCLEEFQIKVKGEKGTETTRTGTFSKLIALAYPATTHYKEEFVLLDHYANTPIKNNVFSNTAPLSKDVFKDDKDDKTKILLLRDVLTVGLYLVDPTVSGYFGTQVTRMGETMEALEKVLVAKKILRKSSKGLEKEWLAFMSTTWGNAEEQLTNFMDSKVKSLKKNLKCKKLEVKIKGEGSVDEPDNEAAPNDVDEDKCAALTFIHDSWVSHVKGKLDARPWEKKNEEDASLGDKRLAGEDAKGSAGKGLKTGKEDQ